MYLLPIFKSEQTFFRKKNVQKVAIPHTRVENKNRVIGHSRQSLVESGPPPARKSLYFLIPSHDKDISEAGRAFLYSR